MKTTVRMVSMLLLVLMISLVSHSMAVADSELAVESQHDQSKMKRPGEEAPTPVPEPATLILLGTGIAGLLGLRRRNSDKIG